MCPQSLQLCVTLWDRKDHNPSGPCVRGISQARILEWVAISSSRGPSQPRVQTCISCVFCIDRRILSRTAWYLKSTQWWPWCAPFFITWFISSWLSWKFMWVGFPGGLVFKTLYFQCRECRFEPCLENLALTWPGVTKLIQYSYRARALWNLSTTTRDKPPHCSWSLMQPTINDKSIKSII